MTPGEALTIVERCARDEEIDRFLIELLRFPTPQTDALEADPQVKKCIATLIAPRLGKWTGNPGSIDRMGNLIWRLGGGPGGFLLMGYAMTYPAASMKDPFSGALVDGQPWGIAGPCAIGRGACEQKGALAAMLYAAAIVQRAELSLRAPLVLAVSLAGETGRHNAAQFILENDNIGARAAIVGLGTGNRICLGNKGRIDIEIIVHGKSAHSSMPSQGINAVDGFRRVMERLERLPLRTRHRGLGDATLTVTHVRTEPAISHTIPDRCHIMVDRRLLPGEDPDAAVRQIRNALEGIVGFKIEVSPGALMYPSEVAGDCALAETLARAYREVTNGEPEFCYASAALDAGLLNHAGLETLMFGPGDLRLAHTDHDLVALADVRKAAKIYAAAALQLLA
ncbi:MAG TPA: M20/M25/M40 family metallo-hydrolase [Candidatus Eisenbacteria bacterium]|nr:M20/M25/M40 family metallo-hydrolase [Candidatus Eisenbacteria bacterium]